jgi:DMSO reductase anchor subunit
VARRHAQKLRRLSAVLLFAVPVAASVVLLLPLSRPLEVVVAMVSVLSAGVGVLTERWLFFAEAEHVVVVYYRGGAA